MKLYIIVLLCITCVSVTLATPFWGSSSKKESKPSSSSSSSHGYPKSTGLSGSSHYGSKPSSSRATSRPSYSRVTPKPSHSRATSRPSYNRATSKPYYSRPTSRPTPRTTPRYIPKTTPRYIPRTTARYIPRTTSRYIPKTTPKTTPRNTPRTTPRSTPKPTFGTSSTSFINGENVIRPTQINPSFSPSAPNLNNQYYPNSGSQPSGAHMYPTAFATTRKPITNVNPPSNFGTLGFHTTRRPMYPNQPQTNSKYVTHVEQVRPTYVKPVHVQPVHIQPPVSYIHIPPVHNQPFYGNNIGVQPAYQPTYVTHVHHEKSSSFDDMLTEILLARAIKERRERLYREYHHRHDHHGHTVTNIHTNNKKPVKKPDVLTNCTMTVNTVNATNVIELPCEVASALIVKNTTAVPKVPNNKSQTNCTIAVFKNNVYKPMQIQCERIFELAPVTELPPLRLDCTQKPFDASSNFQNTPRCTVVNTNETLFPLKVIPLPKVAEVPPVVGLNMAVPALPPQSTVFPGASAVTSYNVPIISNSTTGTPYTPVNINVGPLVPPINTPPTVYGNLSTLPTLALPNLYVADTPPNPPNPINPYNPYNPSNPLTPPNPPNPINPYNPSNPLTPPNPPTQV